MKLIREIKDSSPLHNPSDVVHYLDEFRTEDREMFIVIGLDTRNKPIYREICFIGSLNTSVIHPRETYKKAILMSCASIIVAHNHPSGDVTPSGEDITITKQLIKAGDLLGIKLLDHLILSENGTYSFKDSSGLF